METERVKQKDRNSGIEILRLIAIFSVLIVHSGGVVEGLPTNAIGREMSIFIGCFGNIGVSCFILISGYFGVKRNWKKIFSLECMVIFYSLCLAVMQRLVWPQDYPRSEFFILVEKAVFPVVTREHWYYSCYICLLIFAPYLNLLPERLPKKQFAEMLLFGGFLFCLAPTFLRFDIMRDGGKGLVNMVWLYFLGRYIRLYEDWEVRRKAGWILMVILYFMIHLASKIPAPSMLYALDIHYDYSITMIVPAVLLFYLMKDIKCNLKLINRLAGHVFGIYILNDPVMRVLGQCVFRLDAAKTGGSWFPLWIISLVISAFLVCLIADVLYQRLLGRLVEKLVDLVYAKLKKWKEDLHADRFLGKLQSYLKA